MDNVDGKTEVATVLWNGPLEEALDKVQLTTCPHHDDGLNSEPEFLRREIIDGREGRGRVCIKPVDDGRVGCIEIWPALGVERKEKETNMNAVMKGRVLDIRAQGTRTCARDWVEGLELFRCYSCLCGALDVKVGQHHARIEFHSCPFPTRHYVGPKQDHSHCPNLRS